MKNLIGVTILAFALSLCGLGDRLKDLGKKQDSNQAGGENSNQSNTNAAGAEAPPPAPEETNQNSPAVEGAISGGILNDKAVSLPQPAYPPAAKAARASGTVTVQAVVDETGKVTSAKAIAGHPLLRNAAVQAAYQASFRPTKLDGKPVKVSGIINYKFVLE